MTEEETERYARHIILPEIGGAGQQKLKNARVLVVGVGGLGAAVIAYLAAAGIGTLGLIDSDMVSLANLQRQIIHRTDAIGTNKTASARQTIHHLNPHVQVEEHPVWLEHNNAAAIIAAYDIIIDGSDNAATRYLIADEAARQHRPLISGAIQRFDGSLTVLMPYIDNNPSYCDLFPPTEDIEQFLKSGNRFSTQNCDKTQELEHSHEANEGKNALEATDACVRMGVIGALPGVIGSLQAMEAIKLICQIGEPLIGRLLLYDALNTRFDIINYNKRPSF